MNEERFLTLKMAIGMLVISLILVMLMEIVYREPTQNNNGLAGISKEIASVDVSTTDSDVTEVAVPIQEEPQVVEQPYTDEDLETLAHIIMGECGADYCGETMKYYVGSVALNRVKSDKFPNTLQGVVSQKGQYQCYWDGNYRLTPTDVCYEIAEELLVNGSVLPESVLFQAEFKQGKGVYCKVKNMYFCY